MYNVVRILKIQHVFLISILFLVSFGFSQSKEYLEHRVEQGQTVYSISKYYQITLDELRQKNPSLNESYAVKIGQILLIPTQQNPIDEQQVYLTKQSTHIVQPEETLYSISKSKNIPIDSLKKWNNLSSNSIYLNQELIIGTYKEEVKPIVTESYLVKTSAKTHVVAEKETLYSISKIYQVPLDSLLQWNRLKNSDINVNQRLIIGWEQVEVDSFISEPKINTAGNSSTTESNEVDKMISNISNSDKQKVLQTAYNAQRNNKAKEGVAIWFQTENTMMNSSYYALFSDAKVGSMIRITNLMNNKTIYAKVIGKLPNTAENNGATIKLTPACKKLLQNNDHKLRIRVRYE